MLIDPRCKHRMSGGRGLRLTIQTESVGTPSLGVRAITGKSGMPLPSSATSKCGTVPAKTPIGGVTFSGVGKAAIETTRIVAANAVFDSSADRTAA
jgi:hypothetical protein